MGYAGIANRVMGIPPGVERLTSNVPPHTGFSAHDEECPVTEQIFAHFAVEVVRVGTTIAVTHDLGMCTAHLDDIKFSVPIHCLHHCSDARLMNRVSPTGSCLESPVLDVGVELLNFVP